MKYKKAWVAVTEAVLGIVILFGFVMFFLGNQQKQETNEFDFNSLFINQIENNQSLRKDILNENAVSVNSSLRYYLYKFNNNYDLNICIRDMSSSCSS